MLQARSTRGGDEDDAVLSRSPSPVYRVRFEARSVEPDGFVGRRAQSLGLPDNDEEHLTGQISRETSRRQKKRRGKHFSLSAASFSPPPTSPASLPSPPSFSSSILNANDCSPTESSRAGAINCHVFSVNLDASRRHDYSDSPSHFIPIVSPATANSSTLLAGSAFDLTGGLPPQDQLRRKKAPDKMHRCEFCSKEFPRPSAVRTHALAVHDHARPYPCAYSTCSKTFSTRSNARRHNLTHSEKSRVTPSMRYAVQFVEVMGVPQQPRAASPDAFPYNVRWAAENPAGRHVPT
ncbi:hypothetical protein R3P38DRAFT_180337 [Favolaschia claudopus]|uniref:C2H2-type domain-containing protein n=1 Tax=Favolaschia claudopus TaxID=2862362 RepID=A0AAW0D2E3_9AGAR